jgi:membrane protein implicated in regulation of membrane protease activity
LHSIGIPGLILMSVVVILLILFVISLAAFIRKLLQNSSTRSDGLKQIEEKLDRLIELQERKEDRDQNK